MQNTEGRGLCPPAEQIPKSIAPVISKASATNPLQLPGRSALPCSHGQGRVWPSNWPSMRGAGSQPWLRTQKHNANSSHPIGPSRGHAAFKSLLSWEGGEKQYFRAPEQAGGRKGKASVLPGMRYGRGSICRSLPLLESAASSQHSDTNHRPHAPKRGLCTRCARWMLQFLMCHTGNRCLDK